jgi:hypothetical protein
MELKRSLSCSKEPAACPYPVPDESSPRPPIPFSIYVFYFQVDAFLHLQSCISLLPQTWFNMANRCRSSLQQGAVFRTTKNFQRLTGWHNAKYWGCSCVLYT